MHPAPTTSISREVDSSDVHSTVQDQFPVLPSLSIAVVVHKQGKNKRCLRCRHAG